MLRNYLKIAFRNLLRNKVHSAINIGGLAVGMASALLVLLFVRDEHNYDQFHEKTPQLYRLTTTVINKDGVQQQRGSSGQVQGPTFKAALPEVLDYVRILGVNFNVIGEHKALGLQGLFADPHFFRLFTYPLIHGDWRTALDSPNSIVLTEQTARKFFGKTDVVGKLLNVEDGDHLESFVVTAVTKTLPINASIQFELLLPFQKLQQSFNDSNWLNQYLSTFLLLHPTANTQTVEAKFLTVFQANAHEQLREAQKQEGQQPQLRFGLQPITDLHLNVAGLDAEKGGSIEHGLSGGSTRTYSYVLLSIMAFILVIVCVNFINLSLAGALKRAKEIGVRKVVGSSRTQVISQFMTESALLCVLAFGLAILLSVITLPVFNQLAAKQLPFSFLTDAMLILSGIGILLGCVLLTGLYPAITVSITNPIQVLYGRQQVSQRDRLGRSLTVVQFVLAVGLIVATLVYNQQMSLMVHKYLGYDPTSIIRLEIPDKQSTTTLIQRFRQELLRHPVIRRVAAASDNSIPVVSERPTIINGREVRYVSTRMDDEFLPVLNLKLRQGRNFSVAFGSDSANSVLVNEAFVKAAGWSNPIGQRFIENWVGDNQHLTVIGVVKDYHYGSLRYPIQPQILTLKPASLVWIKYEPGKQLQTLAILQRVFRKQFPNFNFRYSFLSSDTESLYQNDRRWQQIIQYTAGLSILLCGIGLFGLATFTAEARTKEIGVRKVLGASVFSIATLLSKDFLKLVLIAIVIASPIAWYAMDKWLQDFAYKITIAWWVFALAGLLAVGIALLTVSFQSVKAALMNPVKSLRSE